MSEWKEVNLNQVADITTGFAFKGNAYEPSGKLKVVRGENITIGKLRWDNEKYWNKSTEELEKYFLRELDIVIGMDGSRVGHNRSLIKKRDLPLILAQRVACLRARKGFDQKYLWYAVFTDSFKDYVESIHTGTSIPHISQKQIGDFTFKVPSDIREQKAIVSVLSSLDNKIDLLHRQNATLEAMAETLFRQWFIEEAVQESLTQLKIGDLIDSISITHDFPDHKIVFLNTSDIYRGNVLTHTSVEVNTLPGQAKKSIQRNDILFSEIRPANGRFAFIDFDSENYVVSTKLMVLRSKNIISPALIYFYLTNSQTLEWLQMIAESRSGTFPQITFDQLKELKINMPSKYILENSINWSESALTKMQTNLKQIRKLTQIKELLVPKLMNGEVRVCIK